MRQREPDKVTFADHLFVTCIYRARYCDSDDQTNTRLLIHICNYDSPHVTPVALSFADAALIWSNKHWYGAINNDLPDRIDEYRLTVGGAAIGYLYFCVPTDVDLESFVIRLEESESASITNYIWCLNPGNISEHMESGLSVHTHHASESLE